MFLVVIFPVMKNIYLQILERKPADFAMALATVTGTSGSTPRKSGSSALFDRTGLVSGTIGGGIIEKKVQQIALAAMRSGTSGLFIFTLSKDMNNEDEAICGGQMSILLDTDPWRHQAVFEQIRHSLLEGIPGVLITIATKQHDQNVAIARFWDTGMGSKDEPCHHVQGVEEKIKSLLAQGKRGDYVELFKAGEKQDVHIFLELLLPPSQLVIAGAGHIGKALAHLGKLLDFEVTVIDDRAEFANSTLIPDADYLVVDDIGHAIGQLKKTQDTYIVIVTRGHKSDADALRNSIGNAVAYVGMIGSAKKTALIRQKSIDEGWATPGQWEKIHAPIGLPIRSESVQEIAVSIAAQLILERNSKNHIYA
jgi:xanthine dehydrogenase accessory factor